MSSDEILVRVLEKSSRETIARGKAGRHLEDIFEADLYLRGLVGADRDDEIKEHLCHCRPCGDLVLEVGRIYLEAAPGDSPAPWQAWEPGDRRGPRQFESWLPAAWYWLRCWVRRLLFLDRQKPKGEKKCGNP